MSDWIDSISSCVWLGFARRFADNSARCLEICLWRGVRELRGVGEALRARFDEVRPRSVRLGRDDRGREGPATDGGWVLDEAIDRRVEVVTLNASSSSSSSEESRPWASVHDEEESQAEGPQGLRPGAQPDSSLLGGGAGQFGGFGAGVGAGAG